ncbi:MAG: SpoIIE family protein phosphatase [Bacillota bacterium]|nr:SpoIIE family protein phosphatase [Bacillota bacterium]
MRARWEVAKLPSLFFLLGLGLGRASLFGSLSPFGAAWVLATYWKEGWSLALWALGGATAGAFSHGGWLGGAETLFLSLAAILYGEARGKPSWQGAPWFLALLVTATLVGLPFAFWDHFPGPWAQATAQALLIPLLAFLWYPALAAYPGRPPEEERLAVTVALVVGAMVLVGGLGRSDALGFQPGEAASVVMALLASSLAGPLWGASTGLLLGMGSYLFGEGNGLLAGSWALGGLVAGLFIPWGRIPAALGFFLGVLVPLLAAPSFWIPGGGPFLSLLVGLGLFLILPPSFLDIRWWKRKPWPWKRSAGTTVALRVLPGGRNPAAGAGQEDPSLDYASLFRELAATFATAPSPTLAPRVEAEAHQIENMVRHIRGEVCRHCPSHGACWRSQGVQTAHLVQELILQTQRQGHLSRSHLKGFWVTTCLRPGEMVVAVNMAVELQKMQRRLQGELSFVRSLMASHWQSLARALAEMEKPKAPRPTDQLLHYQVGVARRARPGRWVSGDSYLVKEVGPHLLVALSDGMGVGEGASRQSQKAVRLLEKLLDAGVECETAVQFLNTFLLLSSPDESFTTLDLLLLDRRHGQARWMKVGAAPGYWVRRGQPVAVFGPPAPPLGILEDIPVEMRELHLQPGDWVVLVSDGIYELGGDEGTEDWVAGFLATGQGRPPAHLAEGLVEAAARRPSPGSEDDLTALVVRLMPRRLWAQA